MWLEIFKTGTQTDSSGNSESYTEESLDKIAEIYNSKVLESSSFEAPLVKGHPASSEPAYGWVERLARRGNTLLAKIKDVSPELVEQVKKGMYKKISMSIYKDMLLRHVGLLGAVPPAVEGLRNVSFEDVGEFLSYENSFENENSEHSDFELDCAGLQKDNERLKQIISELQGQLILFNDEKGLKEKEARLKEYREYANSLLTNPEGSTITPAQADSLIDILEKAYIADCTQNNTETGDTGSVELIKNFMSSLKPVFSTSEFASKQKFATTVKEFNTAGKNVSVERLKLHERAKEIQSETPGISYEEAVCAAQREQ